jgi:hypothetical protein
MSDSWHSYPKINAIGHYAIADLFRDEGLLVQEKVDGSQFSFGVFYGKIRMKSKSKEFTVEDPEKMFQLAVDTVIRLAPELHDGWSYRGEYLQKPKHNALAYDRVPRGNVVLFDINCDHEQYLPYADVCAEAAHLGLEVVPAMPCEKMTPEAFGALLETTSILGGQKIEGIVVKNYKRFGKDGKALMGKFVSERYKEVHSKEWKNANPTNKDIISLLAEKYHHETRWDKAVQHLRDAGALQQSLADIGALIKDTHADIEAECIEEIKAALWSHAKSHIMRAAVRGLPEWYKEKLLSTAFEKT